jgi:hypothetical protein
MQHNAHHSESRGGHGENHYPHLYLMAGLSFIAMFLLMYAMVDRLANVYLNLNQVYMAGLMAAPMVLIELTVMRAMYRDRRTNAIIIVVSVLLLALFWFGIRKQAAIDNAQFLRSMIPHHAGAILMCEQSSADDPQIRNLCQEIIESQQREIEQMKALLDKG